MAKLTQAMKDFIEKERDPRTIFVGTSTKKGLPNISVKGTFIKIVDDETLAYADVFSAKTLSNVQENPQVTLAIINGKTYKGYQFKGAGEIVKAGALLDEARKANPNVNSVTKVKVQEAYLLDYGPDGGKKVL